MKKEEVNPITLEVKSLSKKYKSLSRDNIRIIHQFCQYDLKRTNKVMAIVEEMKNPSSIIENLVKKPQQSEEILAEFQHKYNKIFGDSVELCTEQQNETRVKEEIVQLDFNFFETVQNDTIMNIMSYLDPYSFFLFSITDKTINQIAKSEAQSDYYKRLCTKLFRTEPPKFPFICRFMKIRDYVVNRPHQYRPNTRNAVLNNLRNYIWKMDMNSFNLQPSYYKSFGSYESLFKNCPLINYNGYYVLRDKYIRIGQKDQKHFITPIHIIYYYRYIRFLEDGSVLYHVRNRRLKQDQVMKYLRKELLQDKDQKQTMIGQYIHYKDKVFLKAVQNREVFSYELQIRSSQNQISNELKVIKYTLELIDDQQEILQTLYAASPKKEEIWFSYCRNIELSQQNSPALQASSL